MEETQPVVFDKTVFLLHGGGALGAYQVGVFKGLSEQGYSPDWVIGTSIGAINSAIIAGNPHEQRVKKLEDFWNTIATQMPAAPNMINNIAMERMQHGYSAQVTALTGQPGFFKPRWWNPWLGTESTADKLSYYDTSLLRDTLLEFVDFDLINQKQTRLSMGAVRIATGKLIYFDNTKVTITPEHVMASCALPPGFPAVDVDGEFYWDGGLHSNTQLNLLLCEREPIRYLCFMVHLFDAYGTRPTNMDAVYKRQKEITYSSHHKQSIFVYRNIHNLRHAIRILGENLPEEKKNDPSLKQILDLGQTGIIHLARFHCKGRHSELSSKDYEFSLPTIMERIKTGCHDVYRVMRNPPWLKPCPEDVGLVLYEVSDTPLVEDSLFDEIADYAAIT